MFINQCNLCSYEVTEVADFLRNTEIQETLFINQCILCSYKVTKMADSLRNAEIQETECL